MSTERIARERESFFISGKTGRGLKCRKCGRWVHTLPRELRWCALCVIRRAGFSESIFLASPLESQLQLIYNFVTADEH